MVETVKFSLLKIFGNSTLSYIHNAFGHRNDLLCDHLVQNVDEPLVNGLNHNNDVLKNI